MLSLALVHFKVLNFGGYILNDATNIIACRQTNDITATIVVPGRNGPTFARIDRQKQCKHRHNARYFDECGEDG